MKYEPAIDRQRLLAAVREAYGLPLRVLHFVPVGFAAICYTARSEHGERFFTDAGAENLLVERGQLYVLDWDEATVAPPEHDLHEARFMDLKRVLAAYAAAGGAGPLRVEHFAFYLLRRHVGDMLVRAERMLQRDAGVDEDRELLHGIEAWGFAQWAALDRTLEAMQDALGEGAT